MRAVLDSSDSIKLPLSWSFARRTSSSGTGSTFSLRNSSTTECTTFTADSREVPTDQRDEAVVIKIAGGRHDDVAGGKAVSIGVEHCVSFKALDGFLGAQDRLAQRMVLPEILGEDFVDKVVWIVLVHFDLLEN